MTGFIKHKVALRNGIAFSIYHNLPDKPGLCIEDVFENWINTTHRYSAKSLIIYIRSKCKGYKAYTEEEYKSLEKQ